MSHRSGFVTVRLAVTVWPPPAGMAMSPAASATVAPEALTIVVESVTAAASFPSLRSSVLTETAALSAETSGVVT